MRLKCKCSSRVLSLLFLIIAFSTVAMAQEERYSITLSNEKASAAFKKMEAMSDYKIQFNYKDVDFAVTLNLKKKTVPEMVRMVISGHGLELNQKGKYLTVVKKQENPVGGVETSPLLFQEN